MRIAFLIPLLALAAAAPASAQDTQNLDKRLNVIEKELRAVQRKVFPGGAGATVEPEIAPASNAVAPAGVPATSAVADLTARLDAMEAQLRTLTGQAEENAHRLTLLEEAVAQAKAAAAAPPPPDTPAQPPVPPAGAPQSDETAPPASSSTGNPAEDAYNAAFRAWNAGRYADAQRTLEDMVKAYPKYPRMSYAQNLLGRAYLDGGKPATAAKIFLGNYQNDPKGDRAQDSLYFLGQSLFQLNKKPEACKVYDELRDVYGATLRSWVKDRLVKARRDANCA